MKTLVFKVHSVCASKAYILFSRDKRSALQNFENLLHIFLYPYLQYKVQVTSILKVTATRCLHSITE